MAVKIKNVCKGSLAYKKGIRGGDILLSFNGNDINDFLDYSFYASEEKTDVAFINRHGVTKHKKISLDGEVSSFGLEFDTFIMDSRHHCKNKCIFCFIDQMPAGMRDTLYFKDDDSRLSFLFGNYITLTNLSEADVRRITDMHICPINISVHTTNPALRVKMMANPNAGSSLSYIGTLAAAGIKMNTQLVLCPGINDGNELKRSLNDLSKYYPAVQSIAAVPVGLTKFRSGLYPLEGYNKEKACDVLRIIDEFNDGFTSAGNERIAFASDEFYLLAQKDMPPYEYYGDFNQLDNGVGMSALTEYEFMRELDVYEQELNDGSVSVATGMLALPQIERLCKSFSERHPERKIKVFGIKNMFFGESVTVSGLVTGRDLINQLKAEGFSSSSLIIPSVMLKHDEDVFLDDVSLEDAQKELNTKIYKSSDGGSLCRLLTEV